MTPILGGCAVASPYICQQVEFAHEKILYTVYIFYWFFWFCSA